MTRRATALGAAVFSLAIVVKAGEVAQPASNVFRAAAQEAGAASPGPVIEHAPIACIEAGLFPEVGAGITPAASIRRSRVYFKAHQYPDWYYVEMAAAEVPKYLALLPRPLPDTQRVDYYVYAIDSQLQSSQTVEYDPQVAKGKCERVKAAGTIKVPKITLYGTREGQPAAPPGFDKKGIVAFVTVAGLTMSALALTGSGGAGTAVAGAGVSGAAGGGGLSTAAIVGLAAGGAAAAGTAALVVANRNNPPTAQVAAITPTGTALVAATVMTFTASAADPDGDPLTLTWDFGDGTSGSGSTATHVYGLEGSFTVTLSVSDGRATTTARSAVAVRSLTGRWLQLYPPGQGVVPKIWYELVQSGSVVSGSAIIPVVPDSPTTFSIPLTSGDASNPRRVRWTTPAAQSLCATQKDLVANDTVTQLTGTSANLGAGCGNVISVVITRE